jgi:hypothetical protein
MKYLLVYDLCQALGVGSDGNAECKKLPFFSHGDSLGQSVQISFYFRLNSFGFNLSYLYMCSNVQKSEALIT